LGKILHVLRSNLLSDGTIGAKIILVAYKDTRKIERKKAGGGPAEHRKPPGRRWRLVDEKYLRPAPYQTESIAKLSHDINTQLYIIIGFAELMLEEIPGKINDEQRRNLNDVLNSGKRLLTLLDGIVAPPGKKSGGPDGEAK
jgi:signal transduction histidine kinase